MKTDIISLETAKTLHGALCERALRSADECAYMQFDEDRDAWVDYTWNETKQQVARWQQALLNEGLEPGDRVAIMLRNCWEWVLFDQAALSIGLVTVPIFTNDRAENVAYILDDSGSRLLLIENHEQWQQLKPVASQLASLCRVVSIKSIESITDQAVISLNDWLPNGACKYIVREIDPDELATIVYTSGTTGHPKGVMLSHTNILWNAEAGLRSIDVFPDDLALSFLPLSHTLERTAGYYLMILCGATVAFSRSIPQLAEDLVQVRPTLMISVPRIFERVYAKIMDKLSSDPAPVRALFKLAVDTGWLDFEYQQGRMDWSPKLLLWPLLQKLVASKVQAKLGGRLRFAISGGAALSPSVARLFIGLGVAIQQGYGLTEHSPVISVNPIESNEPASVGTPLQGVQVTIGDNDELLVRSPAVMLGYWNAPEATAAVVDEDGWLHTGDQARIEKAHIFITGRLKEIIVLSNGEKVSPVDMEMAIALDGLFDQVMVVGEGKPFLTALIVPNPEEIPSVFGSLGLDAAAKSSLKTKAMHDECLKRIRKQLSAFPGYVDIRDFALVDEPWNVENGMLTPTLKLKRRQVMAHHKQELEKLYAGH
jgi:long-chain acyl-CoA synthetase